MGRAYRHPYNRSERPDQGTRPPLPAWLAKGREAHREAGMNLASFDYWFRMYWATPPCLTDSHIEQMKRIYATCPEGMQVDHEVPIRGKYVSGLNVPWNMVHRPKAENVAKGNRYYPGMSMAPRDLFDPYRYDDFRLQPPPAGRRSRRGRHAQQA